MGKANTHTHTHTQKKINAHTHTHSPMRANLIGLEGLVCAFTSTGTAIWKDQSCKYDTCGGLMSTSEKSKGVADEDPGGGAKYWIKKD